MIVKDVKAVRSKVAERQKGILVGEQLRSDHIQLLSTLASVTKERDSLRNRVSKLEAIVDVDVANLVASLKDERNTLLKQVEEHEQTQNTLQELIKEIEDLKESRIKFMNEKQRVVDEKANLQRKIEKLLNRINLIENRELMLQNDLESNYIHYETILDIQRQQNNNIRKDNKVHDDIELLKSKMYELDTNLISVTSKKAQMQIYIHNLENELSNIHLIKEKEKEQQQQEEDHVDKGWNSKSNMSDAATQTLVLKRPPKCMNNSSQTDPFDAVILKTDKNSDDCDNEDIIDNNSFMTAPISVPKEKNKSKNDKDNFHAFIKLKEENRRLRIQLAESTTMMKR